MLFSLLPGNSTFITPLFASFNLFKDWYIYKIKAESENLECTTITTFFFSG